MGGDFVTVLVVDDEREIADLVELILNNEGYTVRKFYDARQALEYIRVGQDPDLALLDVMMPGVDGFALCAEIRKHATYPVILLTARVEDVDKITGLSIGADDYVTKPFNPLELVARVKAQLRRYTRYNPSRDLCGEEHYEAGGLCVDCRTHTVTVGGDPVILTPTEFKILWLLCRNAGEVVSSERIFESVWGEKYLESNNTVMVHIRRMREKMGETSRDPRYVKTVWGVGYRLEKFDR